VRSEADALLSSEAVGVYEVQVQVPRGLNAGFTPVRVIANGISSKWRSWRSPDRPTCYGSATNIAVDSFSPLIVNIAERPDGRVVGLNAFTW
jgi:hypothetical protein